MKKKKKVLISIDSLNVFKRKKLKSCASDGKATHKWLWTNFKIKSVPENDVCCSLIAVLSVQK